MSMVYHRVGLYWMCLDAVEIEVMLQVVMTLRQQTPPPHQVSSIHTAPAGDDTFDDDGDDNDGMGETYIFKGTPCSLKIDTFTRLLKIITAFRLF